MPCKLMEDYLDIKPYMPARNHLGIELLVRAMGLASLAKEPSELELLVKVPLVMVLSLVHTTSRCYQNCMVPSN
jgi:hypothetical protein